MSKFHSGYRKEKIREIIARRGARVHFVGVGGVGMCSLFILSEKMGLDVSGSDRARGRYTDYLSDRGGKISLGSTPNAVRDAELVVYSLAVSDDDAELLAAERRGIPSVSRAEYLGALMSSYRTRVGVSGSHGKSTVSSMLNAIFCLAEKNPTSLIGADITGEGVPVRLGGEELFIYEACEYKDSFLHFSPTVAVFTNLEMDHADYFKDIDAITASFKIAMTKAPIALYNRDDVRLSNIAEEHSGNTVSYAVFSEADFRAYELISQKGKYSFKIRHGDRDIAQITLAVPGKFNVSNALGAFATAYTLGIPAQIIEKALADFQGVERRLQTVGRYRGATVYYDYAHHPTEISNTVTALREMTAGEVTVIFKPHTYSRTAAMMDDFAAALSLADNILLAEIEGIREGAIDGVTSEVLVNKIGRRARLIDEETLIAELSRHKSDAIIIMGAANLSKIKDIIIKQGS